MEYTETDIDSTNLFRPSKLARQCICLLLLGAVVGFASCGHKTDAKENAQEENSAAKKMLQGIWLNDDEDDVAFRVKGDTIYYPDSTSQPVYFYIMGDTLVMKGANVVKYPIVKQAAHIFQFRIQNGDIVKLIKTNDQSYLRQFSQERPLALNQNTLIKRDTVLVHADEKFHLYVQVNPTTYKVYKSSYNDDGVEVDNVYYDNIVNINIFQGARKLFGRDFHKEDFAKKVPSEFLKQAILSDISFVKIDHEGIHYMAILAMPDSSMSYQVELVVSHDGKFRLK